MAKYYRIYMKVLIDGKEKEFFGIRESEIDVDQYYDEAFKTARKKLGAASIITFDCVRLARNCEQVVQYLRDKAPKPEVFNSPVQVAQHVRDTRSKAEKRHGSGPKDESTMGDRAKL